MKVLIFILIFLLTNCSHSPDVEKLRKMNKNSVIHTKEFWKNLQTGSHITDKFLEMPFELKEYIRRDNMALGFPSNIDIYHPSDEERADVIAALKEIPKELSARINQKLLGIFFAKNLGGSALTDEVKDKSTGKSQNKGFVVLDLQVLTKKANEWCSWKESSPFPEGKFKLKCIIANKESDNRKNAISYILLHELAHILNINQKEIPFWTYGEVTDDLINNSRFTKLSWKSSNQNITSEYDQDYRFRKELRYYAKKPTVTNADMLPTYEGLIKTNFPTGYAMNNPWDDFAEVFVNYIHTQIFKRPFLIQIFEGNKLILNYQHCWSEKRCQEKRKFIEDFLKQ